MGAAGYIHPPAVSVRGGALRAPKKKVEGGADLHCPNLTLWFRAALAVQTQADCGAKKWAFTSWGRCQPTHRVVKIPAGILLLSKSLHLKCLVLSGSELEGLECWYCVPDKPWLRWTLVVGLGPVRSGVGI